MDTLLQDIRYAVRKLLRAPGFALVAVATLALAIGATTAVFSIVNGVLLQPLPFEDPSRIVSVSSMGKSGEPVYMSALDYIDYRDGSKSFESMAQYTGESVNLTGSGVQPMRLTEARVGARFFDVLGVRAQRGRFFTANEDSPEAPRVAVISDALWRGRFGADPGVLGRSIALDDVQYTVVGVAEPELRFPEQPDVWVPYVFQPYELGPNSRGGHSLWGIARVKPGASIAGASAELEGIARNLEAKFPESNTGFGAMAEPLRDQIVGDVRPALLAMLGAVGLVLLIACANVANLLLVRAAARESEMAVRTALGAGRGRIVRQLVTESVLLALAGAALGVVLASWAVSAVVALGPRGLPRLAEVAVDGRVLLFAAGVALLNGILFGLAPAIQAARSNTGQSLRDGPRGSSRGGAKRTRNALVVVEMALAVMLLIGAGLLMRSFIRLVNVNPGFRTEQLVTFNVTLPDAKYPFDRQRVAFTSELQSSLGELPGTKDVAVSFGRPMERMGIFTVFEVEGRPASSPDNRSTSVMQPVSPEYFSALGIPLVRGRLYTALDNRRGAPAVVVINRELARRYFATENPIGKRITLGMSHDTAGPNTPVEAGGEIVGIVGDVKQFGLDSDVRPMVYLPFAHVPLNHVSVLVRSSADPRLLESEIRSRVRALDPDLPIFDLGTMKQMVSDSVSQPRFYLLLLGAFAGVALLLAALGVYGVISYAVSQRTRELGIRIALGASEERVVRLVLSSGVSLALGGVVAGVLASLYATRLLRTLLFGVPSTDPVTFGAVALLLILVGALAAFIPARRAASVNPVIAMRAE
ncbi:MAG TPA: ABC transporter permease [Gemmatimonadaceae bacterium]|nr:ABC transporter permease [Gemmatimonadaceae bacterium]